MRLSLCTTDFAGGFSVSWCYGGASEAGAASEDTYARFAPIEWSRGHLMPFGGNDWKSPVSSHYCLDFDGFDVG